MAEVEARRPGRPKREEATSTERRRRQSGQATHKLAIPEAVKAAHPDMEFRWGRDDEGRIQQLTQNDDWDMVPNVDPIHAGKGTAGTGIKMHLLMKPRKFLEEDRAEKMARLDEQDRGMLAKPEKEAAKAAGLDSYAVPGNKIS